MKAGRDPKVSRAIIAAMASVGADGITMQALVERSGSTQKSLRTLLSRLRADGHPFWVVRDASGVRVKVIPDHERPMKQLPLILKRLRDAGDAGLTGAELGAGMPRLSFARSKCRAVKEGGLFCARIRRQGECTRYFSTAKARDAFVINLQAERQAQTDKAKAMRARPAKAERALQPAKVRKERPKVDRAPKPAPIPKKATPAAPKPAPLAFKQQEADYSRAVFIKCISGTDHRYSVRQLDPGHRSALNPAECRPWAMEALRTAA